MAKVKYDPSKKRNPDFKIGEIPAVDGSTKIVSSLLVENENNKKTIEKTLEISQNQEIKKSSGESSQEEME